MYFRCLTVSYDISIYMFLNTLTHVHMYTCTHVGLHMYTCTDDMSYSIQERIQHADDGDG